MEEAQKTLDDAIEKYGISSPEALAASQALDPYKVEEQMKILYGKNEVTNGKKNENLSRSS